MIKVYLHEFFHNVEYRNQVDVKDGVVIKFLANENLDSATIIIPFSEKREIKALEKVEIELYDTYNQLIKTYYYVVDTFNEEQCDFDNSLYTYTLMLVSPTYLLEKVQIPNRKFTPYNNRTTLWQCNNILNYIKKQYPDMEFSDNFKTTFDSIIGVEKQFNKPNAKEALNDILRINNSIVIFKDFDTIDFMPIDKKHLPIDESKLFTNVDSQNANEYVSALKVSAQNCQSDNTNVFTEIIGARALGEAVMTTDNVAFYTQHPINEIVEAYLCFKTNYDAPVSFAKINLINNTLVNGNILIEAADYDLKKNSNSREVVKDLDYKRCHFFFKRNTNKIDGLSYNEGSFFNFTNAVGYAATNIVTWICGIAGVAFKNFDVRDASLMITYKSLENVQYIANKKNIGYTDTVAVMPDNQQDNYINLDEYGKAETSKANRLGNPYKIITATYDKFSDVPKLFDYIDNYILSDIEIACYDDFFNFKGVLYKNYIDQDLFYGVNAKRRTYKIDVDNFVNREEIIEKNIKLSSTANATDGITTYCGFIFGMNNITIVDYTLLQIEEFMKHKLAYAVGQTKFQNGLYSDYFVFTPYVSKSGDSITLNFKTFDNYSIGTSISSLQALGGYGQDYVRYVDDNGQFIKMDIYLFDYSNFVPTKDNINTIQKFPKLDSLYSIYSADNLAYKFTLSGVKDQQEQMDVTIQLNFTSDENIIITDLYTKMLVGISRPFLRVYFSLSDTYDESDTKIKSNTTYLENAEIDYTAFKNYVNNKTKFNTLKLYLPSEVSTLNWSSWCLADTNGNLILAVNRADKLPTELYFNTL